MNPRMLIVGVLAVVCGLSAVFLVQALRKPGAPEIPRTEVIYMAEDVKPGESIAEAMLEVRQVPEGEIPEDAIRKKADAIDRAALSQLDKGDLLRARKLAERGVGRGVASLIRPGMRAFTIQTPSFSSSLAGLLLPGNKVDVLLTANSPGGPDDETGGAMTTTLLQNVEILAIHNNVNAPTTNKMNPDDARSVTLQVSPEDVELLDLGQNKGTLHLSLRNLKDEGSSKNKPRRVADLNLFPARAKPPTPTPTAEPTPAPAPMPEPAPVVADEPFAAPEPLKLTVRTLRGTTPGTDTVTVLDYGPSSGLDTARLSIGRRRRAGR